VSTRFDKVRGMSLDFFSSQYSALTCRWEKREIFCEILKFESLLGANSHSGNVQIWWILSTR